MQPGAVVVVSGPLDPWVAGRPLADPGRLPCPVVVAEPVADRKPYAVAWLAAAARELLAAPALAASPLLLVAHGTAGPLLPALARAQRAAGRRVGGYVFADATLPRAGSPSHLDLLRAADGEQADAVHAALHDDGDGARWPPGAAHPGDHDFWTERLPPAPDWPDAPCGYLHTGAAAPGIGPADFWARSAAARGWPAHTVADGEDVADALAGLIADLPG